MFLYKRNVWFSNFACYLLVTSSLRGEGGLHIQTLHSNLYTVSSNLSIVGSKVVSKHSVLRKNAKLAFLFFCDPLKNAGSVPAFLNWSSLSFCNFLKILFVCIDGHVVR